MNPNVEIVLEPCEDNAALADQNRRSLDISRDYAARLGQETVKFLDRGGYDPPSGKWVSLRESTERASLARVSLPPLAPLPFDTNTTPVSRLTVSVKNRTTLEVSRTLVAQGKNPCALNFAAPVHPGGGFLTGARAQEEGLARSSALYATLKSDPMYAYHERTDSLTASDWAILSPDVPVFRLDDGTLLDETWNLSILTCAAPQAKRMTYTDPALMQNRIERVLAIAQTYRYRTLVLGAWGCGAFGNDPGQVSGSFRDLIFGKFLGAFEEIIFAITDWSPERRFLASFREGFYLPPASLVDHLSCSSV